MPKVRDLTQLAASFLNKEKGTLSNSGMERHKIYVFIDKMLMG
jgi:hypothetical protein